MGEKKSFVLYNDMYDPIKQLSDEEAGILIKSVFEYHIDGSVKVLPPIVNMAFLFIKSHIDRDGEKYQNIVERNRKNGSKGGRPSLLSKEPKKPSGLLGNPNNPDGLFGNPKEPKKADNDNEKGNDNEKKKRVKKFIEENLIIDYFNSVTGKNMKYLPSSQTPIAAILAMGFGSAECEKVIDLKYREWRNNPDMQIYISIQTFFRKSNFEKYLNQEVIKPIEHEIRSTYVPETITEEEEAETKKLIEESGGISFKGKIKNVRVEV